MKQIDASDIVSIVGALLGLALICASIYQVIGWPGVLGFVGGVCLLLGAFMAGTKPSKGNSRRSENLN